MNLFLIPLWKRPEITRICLENLIHFEQSILCIVSRTEDAELCYEMKVPYCWHPNEQLGAKWNYGLKAAEELEWDYMVTLGSDDIVKASLFELYATTDQDILITDKIHFIEISTGRATLMTRGRIGAGRRISRRAIERCGYKLWTESRNQSLDMDSNATLVRAGFACIEVNTDPHVVDLKSGTNIWSFDHVSRHGMFVSLEAAMNGMEETTKAQVLQLLPESVRFVLN